MRRLGAATLLAALIAAGMLRASAPDTSLHPLPRPASLPALTPDTSRAVQEARDATLAASTAMLTGRRPGSVAGGAVQRSFRPEARPETLRRVAAVRTPAIPARSGAVCDDPAILGQVIPAIPGRIDGCGIAQPVKVSAVSGVALSQPATIDCTTAKALREWVDDAVKPLVGRAGGGVAGLRVAAHYSCRTRNNQPGGKISEHGRGRAIDISGIRLADGNVLTVLDGWRHPQNGAVFRKLHAKACGAFGTVLGPESDRFHQDHFHFDTARYRSGSYCK